MEEPKRIQYSSDNPVLNNPYLEPKFHYDTDVDGNVDYSTIINGRRPYGYDISIVPQKAKLVKALLRKKTSPPPILIPTLSMAYERK